MDEVQRVIDQESWLLTPEARRDPEAVRSLLHEDFVEFGASGAVWGRDTITAATTSDPDPGAVMIDVRAVRLGADVILLTYIARRAFGGTSLRTSVWFRETNGRWSLLHHQGTLQETERGSVFTRGRNQATDLR